MMMMTTITATEAAHDEIHTDRASRETLLSCMLDFARYFAFYTFLIFLECSYFFFFEKLNQCVWLNKIVNFLFVSFYFAVLYRCSVHSGLVYRDVGVDRLVQSQPPLFWCCWHVCLRLVQWDFGIRLNFSKRKKSSAKNSINNGQMFCVTTLASLMTGHMFWLGLVLHPV